jgi:hypothetical protein
MTSDHVVQLQQPLKGGGIRTVNFFNGRLLTSKDLSREQDAWRTSDARLGTALGSGVAAGLEVRRDDTVTSAMGPVVQVRAGLAVNRRGQAMRLTEDTSIAVARQFDGGTASDCTFGRCEPLSGGTYVAGAGVYILTIAPSETTEGRAPTNGLDPANVACNTDARVDALQFRLVSVTRQLLAGLDLASPMLRNQLAYRCFGDGIQPDWFAALLTQPRRDDGLLDGLRQVGLSDLEVPLALLYMKGAAEIAFIDVWAVRRPLSTPESSAMRGLVEGHRLAIGQSMFLQFQAQIAALGPPLGGLGTVTARERFRFLPPVGMIPAAEEVDLTDAEATKFFAGMTYRGPAFINAARVESLVRESLCYPPIDTQSAEVVWLYRVRENRTEIELGTATKKPPSYLIFASGHLPYRGDAQFDLSSWNYSNFALAR